MNFTKKRIITTAAAVIITMTPLVSVAPAYAAGNSNPGSNFFNFSGLIQFIAQKLGIDQSKVQSAVNEYQTQHKTQMQQNMQDRQKMKLDKLVEQGKITSSQEQAILDEFAKLRGEYDPANFKNMTPQERQQQFQQEQNELKTWAQSQGIDVSLITPPMGGMRMRGYFQHVKGGPWGQTQNPIPTPTTSG